MTRLFRDLHGAPLAPGGSIVSIGAFDGLHLGHRKVLLAAGERARAAGLPLAVVSFEPLPREYFARDEKPARLSLPRQRIEQLRDVGCDIIGLLRFNAALAALTPRQFVELVLVQRLAAREVRVGPDFRFGNRRSGDVQTLRELGREYGFDVVEAATVLGGAGERVSSSRIRELLAAGALRAAEALLGRPYAISGRVVRGAMLGRNLGYPTANQRLAGCRPALGGVFAVRVHGVGSQPWPGVSSLGTRPAVGGVEPLLETHFFDFDGDLYGRRISVEFVEKLRDELDFPNLDALVEQMDRDAARARAILGVTPRQMPSKQTGGAPA